MQPRLFLKPLLVLLSLLFSCFSFGQRPFSEPIEGEKYSTYEKIGDCKTELLTFKYRLSTITGEPTVYTNLKWKNGFGTATDCLADGDFEIFIHVTVQYNEYWIPAQGSFGLMPKGDNTWGKNPLSGSPDWDELFLTNEPKRGSNQNFLSTDKAKAAWKSGYLKVIGILLLAKNGSKSNIN